jgi:hypothetical protein
VTPTMGCAHRARHALVCGDCHVSAGNRFLDRNLHPSLNSTWRKKEKKSAH